MNLEEATIQAILNETSYSRLYQHTQDYGTFAIIGSEDQTTKEDRSKELYDEVRDITYKNKGHIGYNKADGTYQYVNEETGKKEQITFEKSLIVYGINKDDALKIANDINQQSIVWKDTDFFGILYSNGSVMCEFENEVGKNMSATGAEEAGYGTKLKNDKRTKLGYKFEGHIIYESESKDIEDIIFYTK
jgi:hypothetical protein